MEPYQIAILIIAVSIGFYVQTVAGFAAALVSLPLLVTVLNIQESSALLSIYFLLFSIILIYQNWEHIDKKLIFEIVWALVLGMLLGIYLLKFGSPIVLKKALGVFVVLFVGYSCMKKKKIKLFKHSGLVFGFFGGFFSGLFSAGGPLLAAYITSKEDKAKIVRATIIGTFGITNFLRFPLLIVSNILTVRIFILSLYVLPFFLLSLYLGHKTYHKINEKVFKNILMIVLLLSGISLIIG